MTSHKGCRSPRAHNLARCTRKQRIWMGPGAHGGRQMPPNPQVRCCPCVLFVWVGKVEPCSSGIQRREWQGCFMVAHPWGDPTSPHQGGATRCSYNGKLKQAHTGLNRQQPRKPTQTRRFLFFCASRMAEPPTHHAKATRRAHEPCGASSARPLPSPGPAPWLTSRPTRDANTRRGTNTQIPFILYLVATRDMLRSYHPEHTGSHQNSEVKLDWAGLVLC